MSNPEQNETELEMADRTALTKKYEALHRMMETEDFKLVVTDGYLREEAVRLTSLLAQHGMESVRSKLFEALAAISNFEQYIMTIDQLGAPVTDDEDEDE